jgi:hypothetical protein
MKGTRLSGRRRVDEVSWHYDVSDEPGVYVFFQTYNGPPRYVGRSGSRLFSRIRSREYIYYAFKCCRSDYDAYKWECIYWHNHQDTLDNSSLNGGNHPARPRGSNHRCPVCEC